MKTEFDSLDPKDYILIKGARVHNLKNIDVALPRNQFIVITGLSGSGKSSLAFDTLFAEGQRRYVESLSSYARQFIGRMDKPEVDYISGISPAVAVEQKVNTRNPRSTVGTSTEIYDYLKLLFARIGRTFSPVSGLEVKKHTVEDVLDYISNLPDGSRLMLLADLYLHPGRSLKDEMNVLLQKGFIRVLAGEKIYKTEDLLNKENEKLLEKFEKSIGIKADKPKTGGRKKSKTETEDTHVSGKKAEEIKIVIDRIVNDRNSEENQSRIADSVQTAFFEGHGECFIRIMKDEGNDETIIFSNRFELDGITFEEPGTALFSFNNPYGACKRCEGFGSVIGIDEDLVIPDKSLSVYDGAIVCWKGDKMKEWNDKLVKNALKFDFPIHRPIYKLSEEQKLLLWTGNRYFEGLNDFFTWVESQAYKIQYRVMLSRYRGKTTCPECSGTRLRMDANYVKIESKSVSEIVLMPVKESLQFFTKLKLTDHEQNIAGRILFEIKNRLKYLTEVGLGYLTLNRLSNTLSGGESQRINLATSLGSSLVGSMYILDEPSIGLHPRDTERLIGVLNSLRDSGNTLVVVEHDEEIMKAADELIDIGPEAGRLGGELVYQGDFKGIIKDNKSYTGRYLSGQEKIKVPAKRRAFKKQIVITGARENNLKNLNVNIPLGVLTVVTGVSGSGKTSLIKKVLYPALRKMHGGYGEQSGAFDKLGGDYTMVSSVEMVDQNPIGKSSRSNPVTYVKAYDDIRSLFAELPLSRARKYKAGHFSFNVEGGRCEVCEGEGEVRIEMQFMADIHLVCEACKGSRFRGEILEVEYLGKNIAGILDLTVDEAIDFFTVKGKKSGSENKIAAKLKPLADVGLGYVKLGQSSNTLSGGEAQRVKLASFLGKNTGGIHTLFIFDEPTTGLHFHDISKLLNSFHMLIEQGNSILIIEHNPEIIKCADWIIDLGPEGGKEGGQIVFEGTPEDLVKCSASYTGKYLASKL
ncbi:MAG: excinuclease ABC subunit A [Bacteroidetes bacterium]|nr:MAG: excinuclease ABC subunit A [Bacteroidota bacterium]REJ99764.1 MAG: excinuclease ABC subunit A [Bacteroidota bacterium]REK34137.1 MAG: excinuclease ABC subunit A [Bacteroidota bacterium]REK50467.1 MAG: excinuclease ABC subunit A [Bacteroidota bacterium]